MRVRDLDERIAGPAVPPTVPSGMPLPAGVPPRDVPTGPPTGPWPLPGVGLTPPRPRRRTGRALTVLVAVCAVSALLAALHVPGEMLDRVAALRTGGDQRGVQVLLDRIGAALRDGDGPALAAMADPTDEALRARWGGLPARAGTVGAEALTLRAVTARAGASRRGTAPAGTVAGAAATDDTAPILLPAPDRPGYDRTVQVPVEFGYHLSSWDAGPVSTRLVLQIGRRGQAWWLVDDVAVDTSAVHPAPGSATAQPSPIEPWLRGEVDVVRRQRVMVIGEPERAAANAALADALEVATAAVTRVVSPASWTGSLVAYAPTDERVVASWFAQQAATDSHRTGSDPAAFAAEVRTLPGPAGGPERAAARLAVTPMLLAQADAGADLDSRAVAVLRHEVTHVALALEGDREPPTWMVEGVAEYVAHRAVRDGHVDDVAALSARGLPAATWKALGERTWTPRLIADPEKFYSGTGDQVGAAYTDAWLTCLFIAAQGGEKALFGLYRDAAAQPAGVAVDVAETAALSTSLGTDRDRLIRQSAQYAGALRTRFS